MARTPTAAEAAPWVDRWELQQQHYATARTARLHAVVDVVAHACRHHRRPVIADLGCGPGSLAARLADRLPHAHVLGVDHDPFLLALGRAVHAAAVTFADERIGPGPWTTALSGDGPLDAAVSTTALHYLPRAELAVVYEPSSDPAGCWSTPTASSRATRPSVNWPPRRGAGTGPARCRCARTPGPDRVNRGASTGPATPPDKACPKTVVYEWLADG
ncbi:trans-aconitate 2-methyltransferase [Streptomyces sp. NK15101]|uniref:class I SAM-dependent methyltransferase n=1 Tax=Streptomyces sp. NK15101 TaxID=2873261 RepID=UPI001CECDD93|nr:class I SAM-dependent methyltransferase [Streptomyces sp. NK15101]